MLTQVPRTAMKKSLFSCMPSAAWNPLSIGMSDEIVSLSMGEAALLSAYASLPRA